MVLDATKKAAAQATTSVSNLSVPVKVLASILIFAIGIAFTAGTIWISLLGRMDSLQEQGKDTKSIMLLQGQEVREDLDTVIENQEAFDVAQDMMLKEISKSTGVGYYVVKKGDTIWGIAKDMDIHYTVLMRMNDFIVDPVDLKPGMTLSYPIAEANPGRHGRDRNGN